MRRFLVVCIIAWMVPGYSPAVPAPSSFEGIKPGEVVEVEIADGVKMKFCWVPAGEEQLGSPKTEQEMVRHEFMKLFKTDKDMPSLAGESETSRGKFKTKGFWLGKYEVTQKQWEALMGNNPSHFSKQGAGKDLVTGMNTSEFPVENVSWDDCQKFLAKLNQCVKHGKWRFALPHEDEWEYACRGGKGNQQPFYFGEGLNGEQANCNGYYPFGAETKGPSLKRTTKVGSYESDAPHPWGLCDMIGNVCEWCDNTYNAQNPARALRGGWWDIRSEKCRTASRHGSEPSDRYAVYGFRVAILR